MGIRQFEQPSWTSWCQHTPGVFVAASANQCTHRSASLDLQKWFLKYIYFLKFNFISSFFQNPGGLRQSGRKPVGFLATFQQRFTNTSLQSILAFLQRCWVALTKCYLLASLTTSHGNSAPCGNTEGTHTHSGYGKEVFLVPGRRLAPRRSLTSPLALALSTAAVACFGKSFAADCQCSGAASGSVY